MDHTTTVRLMWAVFTASLSGVALAANPSDFQVFNYDSLGDGNVDLPGRLYVPTSLDPGAKYPLVLFFHGAGEGYSSQADPKFNTAQVNGNVDNLLAAAKSRGFYLYAPQSNTGAWSENWRIDDAMLMVGKAAATYSIDTSRIYVTGLSAGGGGAWLGMSNYSDVFSAAVPICGFGSGDGTKLAGKPIWAFHARDDRTVGVNYSRDNVNAIRTASGLSTLTFPGFNDTTTNYFHDENNLRYTEYATGDHGIWGTVYNTQAMYDWMLAQSSPLHSLRNGDKILFDFGATATTGPDAQGRVWNSTIAGMERTLAPAVTFARTSTGQRTNVSLSVTKSFFGTTSGGVTAGSNYPAEVASDGWIAGDWGNENAKNKPAEIALQGLTPGQAYRLTIFGSDTGTLDGPATYTVAGESQTLTTHGNVDGTVVFDSVLADGNGEIFVGVGVPDTGIHENSFAAINTLEVTPVPEPGCLMALTGLCSIMLSRCGRRRWSAGDDA